MKPRISVITVGVDDLERSVCFYRDGLGLQTEGIIGEQFASSKKALTLTNARTVGDGVEVLTYMRSGR